MRGDQRLMRALLERAAAPAQSPLNSENAPALNAGFAARAERVVVHVRPRGAAVGSLRVVRRAERGTARRAPWRRPASAAATARQRPSGRSSRAVAPRRAGRRRPTRAPARRRRPRPRHHARAVGRLRGRRRPLGRAASLSEIHRELGSPSTSSRSRNTSAERAGGGGASPATRPSSTRAQRVRAGRASRRRADAVATWGKTDRGPAVGAGAGHEPGTEPGASPAEGAASIRGSSRGRGGERVLGRRAALPRDQHARRGASSRPARLPGRTRPCEAPRAPRGAGQGDRAAPRGPAVGSGRSGARRHILRARRGGHRRAGRPRRRGRDARARPSLLHHRYVKLSHIFTTDSLSTPPPVDPNVVPHRT